MRLALKGIASVINGKNIGKTRLKKMGNRSYLTGTPLVRGMSHNLKGENITLNINAYEYRD